MIVGGVLIHTWLEPGDTDSVLKGNRLNGFPAPQWRHTTHLKQGVNERFEPASNAFLRVKRRLINQIRNQLFAIRL